MANEISVLNARDLIRKGGAFGNYTATNYVVVNDRVVLEAICNECGAKNRIQWSHVASEERTPGMLPCINRERHKPAAKPAAPDWARMSDVEFAKFERGLSSEEYRKLLASEAFKARVNRLPKPIDRKQALERQEAADREAKLAPHRAMFKNAYYAYDILINPELPLKLLTDTLRTIRYSYRQTDPDVIELVSLAASMGVAEPDKTNAGGAGLASYEYCPGPLTDPCGHQLNPALANND